MTMYEAFTGSSFVVRDFLGTYKERKSLISQNPLAFDVVQAPTEEEDAKGPEDTEIEGE